jgi:aerobic-type carbon monoxide dehydrogenase small subunit (CoxS/CutS family)
VLASGDRGAGRAIRTVESFTEGTVLHPVQQALCETDGLMCGFCTPGFVVSAVALLEKNPKPTPSRRSRSQATSAGAAPTLACSKRS